ncbi:DNA replication protein [Anopheles sinensis]|uniref:DNA replication protein n=1 Tax=Anopheles sinensis TaxID=74873 RepID=A0A084W288_ANOSI|nr:DNA replication protein [Anopheles sinensis]
MRSYGRNIVSTSTPGSTLWWKVFHPGEVEDWENQHETRPDPAGPSPTGDSFFQPLGLTAGGILKLICATALTLLQPKLRYVRSLSFLPHASQHP